MKETVKLENQHFASIILIFKPDTNQQETRSGKPDNQN
jgi:hypothetical protein